MEMNHSVHQTFGTILFKGSEIALDHSKTKAFLRIKVSHVSHRAVLTFFPSFWDECTG
jgi:hypothetical protein